MALIHQSPCPVKLVCPSGGWTRQSIRPCLEPSSPLHSVMSVTGQQVPAATRVPSLQPASGQLAQRRQKAAEVQLLVPALAGNHGHRCSRFQKVYV